MPLTALRLLWYKETPMFVRLLLQIQQEYFLSFLHIWNYNLSNYWSPWGLCSLSCFVKSLQKEKDDKWKRGSEPAPEKKMEPVVFEKVKMVSGKVFTLGWPGVCVYAEGRGRRPFGGWGGLKSILHHFTWNQRVPHLD